MSEALIHGPTPEWMPISASISAESIEPAGCLHSNHSSPGLFLSTNFSPVESMLYVLLVSENLEVYVSLLSGCQYCFLTMTVNLPVQLTKHQISPRRAQSRCFECTNPLNFSLSGHAECQRIKDLFSVCCCFCCLDLS
jgi:hypothetical protein